VPRQPARAESTQPAPRRTKYALDTNIFLYGFRDPAVAARLEGFHQAHAPFEQLSAVVAHELLAGTRTPQAAANLRRQLLGRFERAGRVFAPTPAAWQQAGLVLAAMVQTEGLVLADMRKSFTNDVVLAVSCRERGVTLITANERDFTRIRRFVAGFTFVTTLP
jgi:predicted nucleic acid-binding protein